MFFRNNTQMQILIKISNIAQNAKKIVIKNVYLKKFR